MGAKRKTLAGALAGFALMLSGCVTYPGYDTGYASYYGRGYTGYASYTGTGSSYTTYTGYPAYYGGYYGGYPYGYPYSYGGWPYSTSIWLGYGCCGYRGYYGYRGYHGGGSYRGGGYGGGVYGGAYGVRGGGRGGGRGR